MFPNIHISWNGFFWVLTSSIVYELNMFILSHLLYIINTLVDVAIDVRHMNSEEVANVI